MTRFFRYAAGLCLAVLMLMGHGTGVYAGSFNGNESELLGLLQGTFEYEGAYYTVASSYVARAEGYFLKDHVDVTDSQKSKAISMLYSRLRLGIDNGYLVPVEDVGEGRQDEAIPLDPEKDQEPELEEPKAEEPKVEELAAGDFVEDMLVGDTVREEVRPVEDSDMPLLAGSNMQVYYDDVNESLMVGGAGWSYTVVQAGRLQLEMPDIRPLYLVLLILGLLVLFGMFWRRRIRRIYSTVWVISMGFALMGIFVSGGCYLTVFNHGTLTRNLNYSAYYSDFYAGMTQDVQNILSANGFERELLDSDLSYDSVILIAKQQMQMQLEGQQDDSAVTQLTDRMKSKLSAQKEGNAKAAGDAIQAVCEARLKVPIGNYLMQFKEFMWRLVGRLLAAFLIFVVLLAGMTFLMHKRRYRILRMTASAHLVAAIMIAAQAIFWFARDVMNAIFVQPSCLYIFFTGMISWILWMMVYISALQVVLAALYYNLEKLAKSSYRKMRRKKTKVTEDVL